VALIVQKYGGTSVADPDRMRAVAENVAFTRRHGNDLVVVVSAMGKATDNLIALAGQVSVTRPGREMDMLLTTGERVSAALLTMALADLGIPAVSFTGSQVGIITDTTHGKAKILEVKGDRVREALADGKVCVVAGFQGVSTDREITTMGRGASDLTASALAKALDADACEIYTDVTGVFSADPRIVPRARKLARVSFDEMLEMAGAGSKVLALRSVEFARNHGVALHVRSAFTWEPGTWVTDNEDSTEERSMEDPIISGVVTDSSESKVTVLGVPDRPGISATLFEPLAAANVNVDMIVQNTSTEGNQLHDALGGHGRRRGHREPGRRRDRRHRRHARRRHRQGVGRRRRHEDVAGHRRQDVPHARRPERQHRDDLDVHDPHLRGHRQRRPGAGGARLAHRLRPRQRRRLRRPPPGTPLRASLLMIGDRAPAER
jgi:aspartate kinase